MSLDAERVLDVEDGSQLYLDPAHEVVWPDGVVIVRTDRKLHVVYTDQSRTVSIADAKRLIESGCGHTVGSRLFDNPAFCRQIFTWNPSHELEFILSRAKDSRRAIEYGVGAGRLLLPLRAAGLAIDGIDSSEPCIRWLADQLARDGISDVSVIIGDMASVAFPKAYDFALAGLNTLRYLPNVARLRRHFHMAALSVAPGGRYLFLVSSRGDTAASLQPGRTGHWQIRKKSGQVFNVEWSLVRSDHSSFLDLERVRVDIDGVNVLDENQIQLSLSLAHWRSLAESDGEWTFEEIADDSGTPMDPDVFQSGTAMNYWLVFRRTLPAAPASLRFTLV
jgi:methyltransferase family protein